MSDPGVLPTFSARLVAVRRPLQALGLIWCMAACSALPDPGTWGRSEEVRAPVEVRNGRTEPSQAKAPSAGIGRGEAAVAPALAGLRANPEGVLDPSQIGYYVDVQLAALRKHFAAAEITLAREGDQLRFVLPGGAIFDSGSTEVTAQAAALLHKFAEVLGEYDKTLVVVEGHSDALGSPVYNRTLSEQRALAVAQILQRSGVAAERLVAVGYGPKRPVADNSTEAGRALNRRVELVVRPVTGG